MLHNVAHWGKRATVTIGILFALKGGHFCAFYRWLKRDFAALFAGLPGGQLAMGNTEPS